MTTEIPRSLEDLFSTQASSRTIALNSPPLKSTKYNSAAYIFLITLLFFLPIPFGSNRPIFWAFWCAISTFAIMAYFIPLALGKFDLRIDFKTFKLPLYLFICVIAYMIVQIIPFGNIDFQTRAGDVITSKTLSLAPGDTFLTLLRWITFGIIFFLTLQICARRDRAFRLARTIVYLSTFFAIYGLIALNQLGDTILFFEKWAYEGALTGTFINRNSFATFLGLGAVTAVGLLYANAAHAGPKRSHGSIIANLNRDGKLILALLLAILLFAIVLTQSRMGIAATLFGIFTVVLICENSRRKIWISLGLIIIIGLISSVFMTDRLFFVKSASSLRIEVYRDVIDMILARPLLGYGAGSFEWVFPMFRQIDLQPEFVWSKAHSTYLANWLGMGIIIGSIPIMIIASIFIGCVRHVVRGHKNFETNIAIGATVVVGLHALVDFSLEIQAVACYFIVLLAMGTARTIMRKHKAE